MMVLGVKKENNKEVVASSAIIMPFGIYTLPLTDKEIVLDTIR